MSVADLMTTLQNVAGSVAQVASRVDALEQQRHTGVVSNTPAWRVPGAPRARMGENIMSSRGFSFGKAIGLAAGMFGPEEAKIESDFCTRLTDDLMVGGYRPVSTVRRPVMVPLWPEAFTPSQLSTSGYNEMKSLISASVEGGDLDEASWLVKKYYGNAGKAAPSPAQSWVDQGYGGTLVGPPMFGPPIELLRNTAALMKAGATVMPLGPSGRIQLPRLTGATQGGWSGENIQQTPTQAKTGDMTLSAKKAIGVVVMPGELLRYQAPAAEGLIRSDLFKTISLVMDKGLLDGQGSDNVPLGLYTMGSNTSLAGYVAPSSTVIGTSGYGLVLPYVASNELTPQNAYDFIAGIEENNATPTGWIMRPRLAAGFFQARWTPYSSGTTQGGFTFDLTRSMGDPMSAMLAGLPITKSVQVSGTVGNGSQTYALCGDWPDYLMALFGAIEFTQSDAGYNLLSSDQVAIRAILSGDGGPRHPGAFAFAGSLGYTVGP